MKFCPECSNMLIVKIIKDENPEIPDKLKYICRNCGFEEEHNKMEDSCILKIDYNIDNIKKNSFINPFIYDDITLLRAEGIKCPNVVCLSLNQKLFILIHNDNMKFIYICLDCYKEGITPHIW